MEDTENTENIAILDIGSVTTDRKMENPAVSWGKIMEISNLRFRTNKV